MTTASSPLEEPAASLSAPSLLSDPAAAALPTEGAGGSTVTLPVDPASPGAATQRKGKLKKKTGKGNQMKAAAKTKRVMWKNDGPDPSVSSLSVLLGWMTTQGNYAMWRGDTTNGKTKKSLAESICKLIVAKGIKTPRSPKDVITKISQLESSFRIASDHLNNTGAGKTVEGSLLEWIEQKCPHYEVLKDIMVERPATRPMATNEDSDFDVAGQSVEEPSFSGEENESPTAGSTSVATTGTATSTTSGVTTTATSAVTTVVAGQGKPDDQRTNSTKRIGSIRVRNTRVASTLSEWGDINSTLTKSKAIDRENTQRMHKEKLEWEKEQFRLKSLVEDKRVYLEERRLRFAEDEARCRIKLLELQAKKEIIQARRDEVLLKEDIARSRKRMREEGIPATEIDQLFPLHFS